MFVIHFTDGAAIKNIIIVAVVCLVAPLLCGGIVLTYNTITEHKKRALARPRYKPLWFPSLTHAAHNPRELQRKVYFGQTKAKRVNHQGRIKGQGRVINYSKGETMDPELGGPEYNYYVLELGY